MYSMYSNLGIKIHFHQYYTFTQKITYWIKLDILNFSDKTMTVSIKLFWTKEHKQFHHTQVDPSKSNILIVIIFWFEIFCFFLRNIMPAI